MLKKERYAAVLDWFRRNRPDAQTELLYHNPFELLVAVILSAQCTDKRVNMVTPELFSAFPTAEAMAAAGEDEIFERIRSISYPRNKAAHLYGMATLLTRDYGGEVPSDYDALLSLPGVGRKTANVISAIIFDLPTMAVDTHVFRVANRIGLTTRSRTPLATERELIKYIPAADVPMAHHWLILHGRYVCTARSPHCAECGISQWCKEYTRR